jgi:Zn-dependent protease
MTRPLRRDQNAGALIFPAVVVIAVATAFGVAKADSFRSAGPWIFGFSLAGWIISLCLHEFMHSVVALAGGDVSVRARGYLTLNPLRYTNWVFSLLIPVILLIAGGIPLPGGAVLIENHRLRRRYWSSLVSAAGPLTNLVLAIVLTLVVAHVDMPDTLAAAISFLAVIQFIGFILNLLPVPGLDGFGILDPYLPASFHRLIAPWRAWAMLILFVLIWQVPQVNTIVFTPAYWLFDQFGGNRNFAAIGASLFQFWRY